MLKDVENTITCFVYTGFLWLQSSTSLGSRVVKVVEILLLSYQKMIPCDLATPIFWTLGNWLRPFLHAQKLNSPGGQTWHAQGFAMVFFAKTLGSHDVTWTYWASGWNSPRVELVVLGDWFFGTPKKSPQSAICREFVWRFYTSTWEYVLNMNFRTSLAYDWKWSMIRKIYIHMPVLLSSILNHSFLLSHC